MNTKKPKVPSLVSLAILTTITIVLWVGFSVYRAITAQPDPVVPEEILAPLMPNLDTDTMDRIGKSVFFEDSQIQTPIKATSPSPSASPTPTASLAPSASPSAAPTATGSPAGGGGP